MTFYKIKKIKTNHLLVILILSLVKMKKEKKKMIEESKNMSG